MKIVELPKEIYKLKDDPHSVLRIFEEGDIECSIRYLVHCKRTFAKYIENEEELKISNEYYDKAIEMFDTFPLKQVSQTLKPVTSPSCTIFYDDPMEPVLVDDPNVQKYVLIEDKKNYQKTGE